MLHLNFNGYLDGVNIIATMHILEWQIEKERLRIEVMSFDDVICSILHHVGAVLSKVTVDTRQVFALVEVPVQTPPLVWIHSFRG